jgi:hypothetical protein
MKHIGLATVALAALLAGCASDGGTRPQGASAKAGSGKSSGKGPGIGKAFSHDPFPSTYKRYPGVPTLVTHVTIFDGEGGKIDDGSVLFADGKIVELGQSVAAPAGATVIDGTGKTLTPGIIDPQPLGRLSDPVRPCAVRRQRGDRADHRRRLG